MCLGRAILCFRTAEPGAALRCRDAWGAAGAAGSSAELPAPRSGSCSVPSRGCQVGSCVFLNLALPWPCPKITVCSFPALRCAPLNKWALFYWCRSRKLGSAEQL